MSSLEHFLLQKLEAFRQAGAFRELPQKSKHSVSIDLSTNDYLGLANDEAMQQGFYREYALPLSASSSRLLAGNHIFYDRVEAVLSDLYGRSGLFFNSGYHLNIGVIPALTSKADLILSDKLIHASLIEGLRLSYAKHIRYRHLDYTHLEQLLERYASNYERIFIVSESLFSMDGDKADLQRLVALKEQYGAYLYLDEAHAVGACGDRGLGLAEEVGLIGKIDFLVGTMGKALSSVGAYLICDEYIKSYLVNTCKSLIYTTALPPVNMAWTYSVLKKIPDLKLQREALKKNTQFLTDFLTQHQIPFVGELHILAILTYDNASCMEFYRYLKDKGISVQAVRPPTVPEGTARIRLSLNAQISLSDLNTLACSITDFWKGRKN